MHQITNRLMPIRHTLSPLRPQGVVRLWTVRSKLHLRATTEALWTSRVDWNLNRQRGDLVWACLGADRRTEAQIETWSRRLKPRMLLTIRSNRKMMHGGSSSTNSAKNLKKKGKTTRFLMRWTSLRQTTREFPLPCSWEIWVRKRNRNWTRMATPSIPKRRKWRTAWIQKPSRR